MRRFALTVPLLLAACGSGGDPSADPPLNSAEGAPAAQPEAPAAPAAAASKAPAASWDLQSSGEGVALALLPGSGPASIRLFCPTEGKRLLVNVPAFRPIGSEERLSIGSGGTAHALVADSAGDRQRGGVTGAGGVPGALAALVGGPISASYGAQSSGPHPAPPQALARAFVAACSDGAPARAAAAPPGPPSASGGPCSVQDGKPLKIPSLRAVGTEPFWGARIEGRCVTYSHPDDQKGTRIWARFTAGSRGGGTWAGSLGGRRFELRTRAEPGCSDGMSDRRYPIAVDLIVGGEKRTGCAERA
jgi:uncharacterized membrane protein